MNKTPCPKIGIKIHESQNEYKTSPFSSNLNPKPNPITKPNPTPQPKTPELCNASNFDLNIDRTKFELPQRNGKKL